MKRKFILDENIIIFAEKLTDGAGNPNLDSLKIMTDIIYNCHSVVVDEHLDSQYNQHFERLVLDSRGKFSPPIIRMMAYLKTEAPKYKYDYRLFTAPLNGEEVLPSDDVYLARLAASTNAILVTMDTRLISALNESGIAETYGIQVMQPSEALALASPMD